MIKYKGYVGVSKVDEEVGLIVGEVIGTRDVITYQGATVEEASRSFKESVDLYLKTCAEEGLEPDKSFSGQILIRTDPAVHRNLAALAKQQGITINELINRRLARLSHAAAAREKGAAKGTC